MEIYRGNIVYAISKDKIKELHRGYVIVDKGFVVKTSPTLPKECEGIDVIDYGEALIIPSFNDLHVHAPQYPNRGIAMDKLLSDWLNDYTFPLEDRYQDEAFARKVYTAFVDDLIRHGTMHACIYATIHSPSSNILLDILEDKGIVSYVGKVNMDKDCPDYLKEDTAKSLSDTEAFLVRNRNNIYSKPILTPRFAPTCSMELLYGLGELADKYNVGCQTHIEESLWEKQEAKKAYEGCSCDMEIYEKTGLLKHKPFLAGHFIYPDPKDIELLKEYDGYAVTCPDATVNVIAGIMEAGRLLDNGVNLGIGSDISAGSYLGIYRQIASLVRLSKIKTLYEPSNRPVRLVEAFYEATKGSGRIFGKVGSFEEGYSFDALVIHGMQDEFYPLRPLELLERFCYNGDSGNILARFLRGQRI